MLQGTFTAIITPFREGKVDQQAFVRLVERQLQAGVHGLVPCGTTGESATLTLEEHLQVVELCVRSVAGRRPVIAGAGSNDTATAIALVRHAKTVGADAALVIAPYYNRPGQQGVFAHFEAINAAVQLPLFVYNVPSRTGTDITVETMGRLATLPNVIGVKDATGDLSRVARHAALCGEAFIQLSGDDPSQVGFNAQGGHGCISVTSNVAPGHCAKLQEATLAGDFATARAIDRQLSALHHTLFLEPSPGPAKFACSELGLCANELRLPLTPISGAAEEAMRAAMRQAGIVD